MKRIFNTISMVTDDIDYQVYTQNQILDELNNHGHPRCRYLKAKKRQRNTKEAAEELILHYEFFHNKKRPRVE